MKKLFLAIATTMVAASCNNSTQTKAGVNSDSTTLAAPETNSNMTDTHATFADSTKPDSNHLKPAKPKN